MWLVRLALRRPLTILVIAFAILGARALASAHARGHFPKPRRSRHLRRATLRRHVALADGRAVIGYYEYHFLYINGIEHIESAVHPGHGDAQAVLPSPAPTSRSHSRR